MIYHIHLLFLLKLMCVFCCLLFGALKSIAVRLILVFLILIGCLNIGQKFESAKCRSVSIFWLEIVVAFRCLKLFFCPSEALRTIVVRWITYFSFLWLLIRLWPIFIVRYTRRSFTVLFAYFMFAINHLISFCLIIIL